MMTLYKLPVMVRQAGKYGVPGLIDLSGNPSVGLGCRGRDREEFLVLHYKNAVFAFV